MGSKKFQNRPCVYCTTATATTADHVIARQFVSGPLRANLPKVPACSACNNAKSQLEHYLATGRAERAVRCSRVPLDGGDGVASLSFLPEAREYRRHRQLDDDVAEAIRQARNAYRHQFLNRVGEFLKPRRLVEEHLKI